jgi:hypothetical protein
LPNGGSVYRGSSGREWQVDQSGHLTRYSKAGLEANFGNRGQLTQAHIKHKDGEMQISRGVSGYRHVEAVRSDHSRLVSLGNKHGYVERKIDGRKNYVTRSYVTNGVASARVYRTANYQNISYYQYVPAAYYSPAFYRWTGKKWSTPVVYTWDWSGDAWVTADSTYFKPEHSYRSASMWMTDYLLSENLKLAFEPKDPSPDQQADSAPTDNGSMKSVTPAIKQALAVQLANQLDEMEAESKLASTFGAAPPSDTDQKPPSVLDPQQRFLVVAHSMDITTSAGVTCSLTGGDIIIRTDNNINAANKVAVNVMSNKAGDCPASASAEVELAALQEQSNEMRVQMEAGLNEMNGQQNAGKFPNIPHFTPRAVPEGEAVADDKAPSELDNLLHVTDTVEADIKQSTVSGTGS